MKGMKKFFAMFLAMAMVLGMSMTTFAAGAGTPDAPTPAITNDGITVEGIAMPNEAAGVGNATVKYAQIIKPAVITTENPTGWEFVDNSYAAAYKTALDVSTDVAAIQKLIATDNTKATEAELKLAISSVSAVIDSTAWKTAASNVATGSANWTVTAPGLYVVKIDQSGYNYRAMSAYVQFGQVSLNTQGQPVYTGLTSENLTAKGSPLKVDKTNNTGDNAVAVGDVITYTITTRVPYIAPENLTGATYRISDTITGAEYVNLNTTSTIKYTDDNSAISGATLQQGTGANDKTFTVNLDSVLTNNANAGREIAITYEAKITEIDSITNTAKAGHLTNDEVGAEYGTDTDEVFTGGTKITKLGENNKKLSGAEFEVRKDSQTVLNFIPVYKQNSETEVDYYKYVKEAAAGSVTKIITATNGEAVIKGLDLGTYYFKEVKAPAGYSINDAQVSATIEKAEGVDKVTAANQITSTGTSMTDTKLSSLPSTGGIGTTIFTIGGCAIMIIAAGLYFSFRKKNAK